jgi:hypothetical protein
MLKLSNEADEPKFTLDYIKCLAEAVHARHKNVPQKITARDCTLLELVSPALKIHSKVSNGSSARHCISCNKLAGFRKTDRSLKFWTLYTWFLRLSAFGGFVSTGLSRCLHSLSIRASSTTELRMTCFFQNFSNK